MQAADFQATMPVLGSSASFCQYARDEEITQKESAKMWVAGRMELTYGRHTAVFVDLREPGAFDAVRSISELPELDMIGNAKGF